MKTPGEGVVAPRGRVVLLGASNLTRGVATVARAARHRLGAPLDLMVAFGHGRSYGVRSRVAWRELPGIAECGLWEALTERTRRVEAPTFALVADVGNDLAYGETPERIESWVATCLERLARTQARIVIVQLPTPTLGVLTPAQVWLLRNVYFARHDLDLAVIQARVQELAGRLSALATRFGATLVEQELAWYGFDPIHYPLRRWARVWSHVLDGWGMAPGDEPSRVGWPRPPQPKDWLYVRSRLPERCWLFGRETGRAQPCGRLADGSTLSLY